MVVDDNHLDCFIAEKQLKNAGVTDNIEVYRNAGEALAALSIAAANPSMLPELILLDINMPEVNGFDFLSQYGKLPDTVKDLIYIVMLTSSVLSEDRIRVSAYPFVRGIIHKPLTRLALKQAEGWL